MAPSPMREMSSPPIEMCFMAIWLRVLVSDQPHALDIALRRSAKQAAVLAAELRGAFIAHEPCGATRVEVLVQHQLPCFLYTQLLLELQGTQAREGAEVLPEGGRAHVRAIRQLVHVQRLNEVLLEPGDGLRNLL